MKSLKLNKKQIIIGTSVIILLAGISIGIYFLVRHFQRSSSPISSTGGVVSRVVTSPTSGSSNPSTSCMYSSQETEIGTPCQVTPIQYFPRRDDFTDEIIGWVPYGDGLPRTTYGRMKISGPSSCASHVETRTEVCTSQPYYFHEDESGTY